MIYDWVAGALVVVVVASYYMGSAAGTRRERQRWTRAIGRYLQSHPASTADSPSVPAPACERR